MQSLNNDWMIIRRVGKFRNEGVKMYDGQCQEKVLVVAPLMLVNCDKQRASELVKSSVYLLCSANTAKHDRLKAIRNYTAPLSSTGSSEVP